jgi:hypothetical protein
MVRLDRLVNVLGGYGVRLCCCPVSRSTELRGVVLRVVTDDRAEVGDVQFAVGTESVAEAVRAAVSARAAVVLLRGGEELLADAVAVGLNSFRSRKKLADMCHPGNLDRVGNRSLV